MRFLVTAGPTYEPFDKVRRLTNGSTGRLGSELANALTERGHEVALLLGSGATYRRRQEARIVREFTTTADLRSQCLAMAGQPIAAVFHAAAVSDFAIGAIWERQPDGTLVACADGKISTRRGPLLAEFVPTPKIISELRDWFPRARLVGWKYEVDGDREGVVGKARDQMASCRTDACVANGPAYGAGFGLLTTPDQFDHLADATALYRSLAEFVGA